MADLTPANAYRPVIGTDGSNGFALTIDGADEAVAGIYRITSSFPDTALSLIRVQMYIATMSAADLECRVETVNTSTGLPTGTLFSAGATVTQTVSTTAFHSFTFGSAVALSEGDIIAIVIKQPTTSFGNHQIQRLLRTNLRWHVPYIAWNTGSYAKRLESPAWTLALTGDTRAEVFAPGVPTHNNNPASISTGLTYNEVGIKFTPSAAFEVNKMWYSVASSVADCTARLYADGTQLWEEDIHDAVSNSNSQIGVFPIPKTTLDPTKVYRLTIRNDTANTRTVAGLIVNATKDLIQLCGTENCHRTKRQGSGSWTDETNGWAEIGLIESGLDNSGGGGGGSGSRIIGSGY